MDFLIRFVQTHESFRKPEIEALAVLANVDVDFLSYSENVRLGLLLLLLLLLLSTVPSYLTQNNIRTNI